MQTGRNIASFLLLLLLAAPLLVLSVLQLKQAYIRYGMEERLEKGLLKTIFVSKHDLKRINSDEILVAGKMFDVKELQETDSGFAVTGVFDDDETAVLNMIQNTCTQEHSKHNPVFAQAFQLLQDVFFQSTEEPQAVITVAAKLFQNPIAVLPVRHKQVRCPPPQHLA